MTPHFKLAYNALWISHPVLLSAVVVAMWRRQLHRKFPAFFAYCITEIVMFSICYPIYQMGSYRAFFYSHWTLSVISLLVGFLVIHEIFSDIFRPFHALKDMGTILFTWAGLVMLMVAAVVAAASPPSQSPIVEAAMTLQRCVRVTQCGLILFLLVFSRYLGVSRLQKSFGLALGFGGFAVVELSVVALFASGRLSENTVSLLNLSAYSLAILTWFGYCLVKNPVREDPASLLATQRWDQSLSDIQNPVPTDSLIPMFEGMVERAFSRNQSDASVAAPQAKRRSVGIS